LFYSLVVIIASGVGGEGVVEVETYWMGWRGTVVVDLEEATGPLDVPGTTVTRTDGPRQWLRFRRSETTAAQVIARVAATARLRDLTIEESAIEDIVRGIYERSSQEAAATSQAR